MDKERIVEDLKNVYHLINDRRILEAKKLISNLLEDMAEETKKEKENESNI